jgi:hypothetical protein
MKNHKKQVIEGARTIRPSLLDWAVVKAPAQLQSGPPEVAVPTVRFIINSPVSNPYALVLICSNSKLVLKMNGLL